MSKLLADSIVPIENYDPSSPDHGRQDPLQTAAKKVYIRLPSRESREYAKVVNLLSIFDGDIPVILCMKDSGKRLAAPRRLYTSGHPLFFKELERLFSNAAECDIIIKGEFKVSKISLSKAFERC